MDLDKILKKKIAFLERYNKPRNVDTAIDKATGAALQHNSLYDKNISSTNKDFIKEYWKCFLRSLNKKYRNEQIIDVYESDVRFLNRNMNKTFANLFRRNRHPKYGYDPGFRISHSQKSISVYLKHLWCRDLIHGHHNA
jgi:hypothetical protein